MRVVLTNRLDIVSSKDKVSYTKASYLAENGSTGEVFVKTDEFNSYSLPADRFIDKKGLAKVFAENKVTEVDFSNRGRVEGLR